MNKQFKVAKDSIKQSRDHLLRLHKVLMDWDRSTYEEEYGPVSPGKFLEMLMTDPRFDWLRVLSMLIVRIDEAFDLDDGVSMEMLEGFRKEIRDTFDQDSGEYGDFQARFRGALPHLAEAGRLRNEVLDALDW